MQTLYTTYRLGVVTPLAAFSSKTKIYYQKNTIIEYASSQRYETIEKRAKLYGLTDPFRGEHFVQTFKGKKLNNSNSLQRNVVECI